VFLESRKSWQAATWLLKSFDDKLKAGDTTPDEWHRLREEEHEASKKRNRIR
jgi:hypothetical protein